MLNERLAAVLPSVITENQSGFLKGRLITDNILLTQELIHSLDVKTRSSNLALKIDMTKADDRVNWAFLSTVLKAFGFSEKLIDLVMRTINNCHLGIMVNGASKGFIKSLHGLRQGDPLSPALFILEGEYLSRGLNRLFAAYVGLYFDNKKGLAISHLTYADALIVFTKGSKEGLKKIMKFLQHYEKATGQKMNMAKSNAYAGQNANVSLIESQTGFEVKDLPFYYLGAPISKGRKNIILYALLVEKIRDKLSSWNIEFISQGGRWTLIKSVLTSMPVYLLQVCLPLVVVLKMIDRVIANFFWGPTANKKRLHWSKWKPLCFPVSEGGVGVRSLGDICTAFSCKLWVRFREQQSLWAKSLKDIYCKKGIQSSMVAKKSDSLV